MFPNVEDAERPDEQTALEERYQDASRSATKRNCGAVLSKFEEAVKTSQAVFTCRIGRLIPIATGDGDLYATYYELRRLRLLAPPNSYGSPDWDRIRPAAEVALFGEENRRHVHYAALTLDEEGLRNYGECTILLREQMIAHRTSTFEQNSILFMKTQGITIWGSDRLPKGHRSNWSDRHKLCIAKLHRRLKPTTAPIDFPGILLQSGITATDDDFIELHVFGPITIRTVQKIRVDVSRLVSAPTTSRGRKKNYFGDPWIGALRDVCMRANVEFETH